MSKVWAGLLLLVVLSGCTKVVEVPVFVESQCPRIELVDRVAPIEVMMQPDGSIEKPYSDNLLRGSSELRRSENYYIDTITDYNKKFVDKVK